MAKSSQQDWRHDTQNDTLNIDLSEGEDLD
jgi:hypothetical protein